MSLNIYIMSYLVPEKNLRYLKLYHTSSKLLIPSGIISFGFHQTKYKNLAPYCDIFNIINFTFHSYVSTSCIITDYVKIKHLEPIIRKANMGGHIMASIGFINIMYKYNKN